MVCLMLKVLPTYVTDAIERQKTFLMLLETFEKTNKQVISRNKVNLRIGNALSVFEHFR